MAAGNTRMSAALFSKHARKGIAPGRPGTAPSFAGSTFIIPPVPEKFELACFLRWFVLWEHFSETGGEQFWHLDNDQLVFSDMSQDLPREPSTRPRVPFYCRDIDGLRHWCDTITENIEEAWKMYDSGRLYTVSDMTMADLFGGGISMEEPRGFDMGLHLSAGFTMENGRKKITWIDGRPHFSRASDGKLAMMRALHLWDTDKYKAQSFLDASVASLKYQ